MGTQTSVNLREYITSIRKRWWLVVLLPVIAVVGAYSRFGHVGPSYSAGTTLEVTQAVASAPTENVPRAPVPFAATTTIVMNDLVQLSGTREIAERVARRLDLHNIGEVQSSISASILRDTDIIRIEASAADPDMALAIANTASDELIRLFRETNSQAASNRRQFVEQQLEQARQRLEVSDRAILAARQNPSNFEGAPGSIVSSYFSALTALDDAHRSLRETDQRLAAVNARLNREPAIIVSETARVDNPAFTAIQARLVDLQRQQIELAQSYTPQHPRMRLLQAQIAGLRKQLTSETRTVVDREVRAINPLHATFLTTAATLEVDRAVAAARIAALEATIRTRYAAATSLLQAQSSLALLMREQGVLEANYRTLSQRYQEAVLRENSEAFFPAGIVVVERAAVATRSEPARFRPLAVAALLGGLLLGTMAAVVLEATDEGVRTPEDLERTLGVPVLAEVPNANPPRVGHAPAMFVLAFIFLFALGFLAAYTRTSFTTLNLIRGIMRPTLTSQLETQTHRMTSWVQAVLHDAQVARGQLAQLAR